MTDLVPAAPELESAGIDKHVEIGLRFAPSFQAVGRAASSLAHMIALHPDIPIRLAGVQAARSRVHLTIAVGLGSLEDIKVAGPASCGSVAFMRALVKSMAAFDPAFVQLPDPASKEAMQARRKSGLLTTAERFSESSEPALRSA